MVWARWQVAIAGTGFGSRGCVAAAPAHEMNSPMNAIHLSLQASSEGLEDDIKDDEPTQGDCRSGQGRAGTEVTLVSFSLEFGAGDR